MFLRNAAKAIIVREGKILAHRVGAPGKPYYILPGGAQEPGETLTEAIQREVREEMGAEVRVGKLAYVREYIARNHEFAEQAPDEHGIDFYFECRLVSEPDPARRSEYDAQQTEFEWLDLARLDNYPFWPRTLIPLLSDASVEVPVYLGDVN